MLRAVPAVESTGRSSGGCQATESVRVVGSILDRLGLRLGIRIVVGCKGSRMGLGYARKSQQMVNRLVSH